MSERDVLELVHRAAAEAPPMQLSAASVLEGGRRRVRRRRATAAGMTLAAAASIAAVSFGLVGDGFLATQEAPPAEESQEVVSSDRDAALTFADGTTYELQPDGDGVLVTSGETTSRLGSSEVAGTIVTLFGEGHPVLLVPGWDVQDLAAVRVGSFQEGDDEWLMPSDVTRVDLVDGRPLVAVAITGELQTLPEHVPAEMRPDGTAWLPGPGGVTLALTGEPEDGRQGVTPVLEGQPLSASASQAVPGALTYDAGERGMLVVLDATAWDEVVPIVRDDSGVPVPEPDLWVDIRPAGPFTLAGLAPHGAELMGIAVRSPDAVPDEGLNPWGLLGVDNQARVVLDGGVVTVGDGSDLWLFAPDEADVPVAGVVGQDVVAVRTGATTAFVVTTHRGSKDVKVLSPGTASEGGSETGTDAMVFHSSLVLPPGSTVLEQVPGADTDGDGTADLPLTQVVDPSGTPLPEDG